MSKPPRYVNPWPNAELDHRGSAFFRWQWQRVRQGIPPAPAAGSFPLAIPSIARPRGTERECRITWIGQSSFLLQTGTLNLLLDPVFSLRASPSQKFGPARVVEIPLQLEDLPPIDAVLLSHDHYDHLDEPTVHALRERFGADLKWITPLGYQQWFGKRKVQAVVELNWWESAQIGATRITALPAQHWTRRGLRPFERLWCSFMIESPQFSVFFCGDSGYCPAFREIGAHFDGCDVALLPIGAYEPRWFMRPSHMNPEEAVQTFVDLRARTFVPMHWGTFRLTDEDMLEPPQRVRAAWSAAQLPADQLKVLRHGETLILEK